MEFNSESEYLIDGYFLQTLLDIKTRLYDGAKLDYDSRRQLAFLIERGLLENVMELNK